MTEATRMPGAGVILAGGNNTRMNAPKAFMEVGGRRVIDRQTAALGLVFDELMVVAGQPEDYSGLGVRAVTDDPAFSHIRGPLIGVYSGLKQAVSRNCFIIGCDMPFIDPGLVRWMAGLAEGHDAVIPDVGGYAEPLFGVYSKSALRVMESALSGGVRRLSEVFLSLDVLYVPEEEMRRYDPELLSLFNANTPSDLDEAREIARRIAAGHFVSSRVGV